MIKQTPILSITIVTHQRPHILGECLMALVLQTYQNFEVIIVNNDQKNIDYLIPLYPELTLKIINNPVNNMVKARNIAVAETNAKYILLLDDDDILLPGHVEQALLELKRSRICCAPAEIVNYKWLNNTRVSVGRQVFAFSTDNDFIKRYNPFIASGCTFEKKLLEDVGNFDEGVYNYWDWDFFIRVSAITTIKRLPEVSVLYFFNNENNLSAGGNNRKRSVYLSRFCEKHQINSLDVANFLTMISDPKCKGNKLSYDPVWKGSSLISRTIKNLG